MALVIGIAQHTTRGTSRPFVPIVQDELSAFTGEECEFRMGELRMFRRIGCLPRRTIMQWAPGWR